MRKTTAKTYIHRTLEKELKKAFQHYPIITVIGARQTGKSTITQHAFNKKPYANLEDPDIRLFAEKDPRAFLNQYPSGAILDEIQNVPKLLPYLQVITDAKKQNGLFILTGSHQLPLHEAVSQSLAGRTALFELPPLSIDELSAIGLKYSTDELIFQGFLPRIYKEKLNPTQAYRDYFRTYIERDVRKIINIHDLSLFQSFLKICASRIGQVLNIHNIGNELGTSNHTIKAWLSVLEASFIVKRLQPYYENFGKRIIKSPKLYFVDTGLATYLLDINDIKQVQRDPLRGQLFENLVVMELFKYRLNKNLTTNYYFYRDKNLNEVDMLFKEGNDLVPIEIKSSQTFNIRFLKNLEYFAALDAKRVPKGFLIYSGSHEQAIGKFEVLNYKNIAKIFA